MAAATDLVHCGSAIVDALGEDRVSLACFFTHWFTSWVRASVHVLHGPNLVPRSEVENRCKPKMSNNTGGIKKSESISMNYRYCR